MIVNQYKYVNIENSAQYFDLKKDLLVAILTTTFILICNVTAIQGTLMHRITHSLALGFFGTLFVLLCFLVNPLATQAGVPYFFQGLYSETHPVNAKIFEPTVQEINKKNIQGMQLDFFPEGEFVTETAKVASELKAGEIQLASLSTHYEYFDYPYTTALQIPYLVRDSRHASELYWQAYTNLPEIKQEIDKLGKVFTVWGSDRSALFSSIGPIRSPEDLKGKRVLVWGASQLDIVKAWGGIPVQTSSNKTLDSLKNGLGDVFFGPIPAGLSYNLSSVTKDITLLPSTTFFMVLAMNQHAWDVLNTDQQNLLMDKLGGHKMNQRIGQLLYETSESNMATMTKAGCTIHHLTPAQAAVFRETDEAMALKVWEKDLLRLGISDPQAWLDKLRTMAAEIK